MAFPEIGGLDAAEPADVRHPTADAHAAMRPVDQSKRRFTAACSADNQDESRIASPEMLLGVEPLPHLICSRPAWRGGDGDEAGEHGDT